MRQTNRVIQEIRNIKNTCSLKQYELDLTLAFWFAVHLEDLPTASALLEEDFLLKQLVACALFNKKGDASDEESEELDDDELGNSHG